MGQHKLSRRGLLGGAAAGGAMLAIGGLGEAAGAATLSGGLPSTVDVAVVGGGLAAWSRHGSSSRRAGTSSGSRPATMAAAGNETHPGTFERAGECAAAEVMVLV